MQAVVGHGVADRVARAVAVGLVKEVDASVQDDSPRCAEAVLLARLLGQQFAQLVPLLQVVQQTPVGGG